MNLLKSQGYNCTPMAFGWRCIRIINIGGFDHQICLDVQR